MQSRPDGYSVTGYIAKPAFIDNRGHAVFHRQWPVRQCAPDGQCRRKGLPYPAAGAPRIAFLNLDCRRSGGCQCASAKLEVKFTDSSAIFRLVYRACLEALTVGPTLPKEEGHMLNPMTPLAGLLPAQALVQTALPSLSPSGQGPG